MGIPIIVEPAGSNAYRANRLVDDVQVLGQFHILSFTEPAIDRFIYLKGLKLGVRHMDLRIAAIIIEHGGTVVTRNERDFRGIRGLPVVDWSR